MDGNQAYSIAPWLTVRNAEQAVRFYIFAFGAEEVYRLEDPEGSGVSRLSIHGAEFWVSGDSSFNPESPGNGTIRMILTVPDPDAVFGQALTAGASEIYPVEESHGWRVGRLADPFGYHWEIGRLLEE
ncbi:VOC family protein [Cohnella pontilimi]|uniref:VOC family protein n=1 Tax=Cohnella pontilimi TaxID=2564100 RepID=A0A4U0FGD3_9BACL|nr:VOC family protein [Cohnella pontilimi]TJY44053.1 VOC family protein [Cohnella pontilimi]